MKKNSRSSAKGTGIMGNFKGRVDSALHKLSGFKSTKLSVVIQNTLSRLVILKNQRRLRCAHGRDDIAQLLLHGHHEIALIRAGNVLIEQNTLELFNIVQSHCDGLLEKYALLKRQRKCPNELKESISDLIFVSSSFEEIPELSHIRSAFSDKFGKEFVRRIVELQEGCMVNDHLINKVRKKEPSSEEKLRMIEEIRLEKKIDFDLAGSSSTEKPSNITMESKKFIADLTRLNQKQATPRITPQATPRITPQATPRITPQVTPRGTPRSTPLNSRNNSIDSSIYVNNNSIITSSKKTYRYGDAPTATYSDYELTASSSMSIMAYMDDPNDTDSSRTPWSSNIYNPNNEVDHAYVLNNAFKSENIRFSKGKLVCHTYDADTEEDKCDKCHHTVLESRKMKWQRFHFKKSSKAILGEVEEKENGSCKNKQVKNSNS
ncbi:hypothetical protein ZOSMA_111G00400 [Zostera marina]|uniref:Uncharacterized protein n=1 Tax=Zostera marina TaxID=29655 RepID=A0A0K9Q3E6_ZOSMR|nr:hypothetical protein ZOSMA_111G00400 [Zostera marina]